MTYADGKQYMKIFSIIREMQMKTTMRYSYAPMRNDRPNQVFVWM